jgi:hypothetical protein
LPSATSFRPGCRSSRSRVRYFFAGTGDAQNGDNAQNTKSLNGKVLRINPDGSIPSDNPFGNAVWSYGHRLIAPKHTYPVAQGSCSGIAVILHVSLG